MSRWFRVVVCVSALCLVSALLLGCSDDDNGGNGVGPDDTLTAEEQLELFDMFVYFDTTGGDGEADRDSLDMPGLDLLNLGIGMVHVDFIDGVSPEVVSDIEVPGLPKLVPMTPGTGTVSIDYINGWWEIEIDSAVATDMGTYAVHFEGRVRFEDFSGNPQETPGFTTTRFIEQADVEANYNRTNQAGATEIIWDANSEVVVDINPLTASAELNTTSSGKLTADYTGDEASFAYVLDVNGHTDDVTISLADESICPSEGSVSVDMDLKYDATGPEGTDHVDADWSLNATIQEGGVVVVTIQSGDFTEVITTDIECGDSGG